MIYPWDARMAQHTKINLVDASARMDDCMAFLNIEKANKKIQNPSMVLERINTLSVKEIHHNKGGIGHAHT